MISVYVFDLLTTLIMVEYALRSTTAIHPLDDNNHYSADQLNASCVILHSINVVRPCMSANALELILLRINFIVLELAEQPW